ncbi:hypothetical protein DL768_008753 [Monosporascus sp. mg162]|nr:hypothetical protein DL768_008753 [Monosporascus sp. mg162]
MSVQLAQCRPIRAFWEVVPDAQCFHPSVMWTAGYIFIGIGMVGDMMFTVMPMFFIWKLQRSLVERCLISFLMAMCLFATAAGIPKIIYSEKFDRTSPDVFREMMPVFLWCRLEEVILVVASSAPLLKASIEGVLVKLGMPKFQFRMRTLQSISLGSIRLSARRHWESLRSRNQRASESELTKFQSLPASLRCDQSAKGVDGNNGAAQLCAAQPSVRSTKDDGESGTASVDSVTPEVERPVQCHLY